MEKGKSRGIIIIFVCILLSFICGTVGAYLVITTVPSVSKNIVQNVSKLEYNESSSIAESADRVKGGVVVVVSYKNDTKVGTGTGFAYKKDGKTTYVMTNNHVIAGADSVKLILDDGDTIDASIVGGETYSDIAVLKTEDSKLSTVLNIGNSANSKVGDTIYTVGSPMGETYRGTVTKGILSGKDRLVEVSFSGNTSDYYMKVLQIDAAINPGNSGGPLLNLSGEVIGINSLKLVQQEIEGMGFAIPIEDALNYAQYLETGSSVDRPYVGISMLDISDQYYLWQNGIKIPDKVSEGVAILSVVDGSPASEANLQKGDIIISLNGDKIKSLAEFRYVLYKNKVGDKVDIEYLRNGKVEKASITLGKNNTSTRVNGN